MQGLHVVNTWWRLAVPSVIVSTLILALVLRTRRSLAFSLGAVVLLVIGLVSGDFPAEQVWTSINSSMPILLMVISLQLFSAVIIDSGISEWAVTRFLSSAPALWWVVLAFILLTYFVSLWVNNLAAMLVVLPFVIATGRRLQIAQQPLLAALVIASNLGGASTMIGDFPNIVISRYAQADFMAFLLNLGVPILFLVAALIVVYYFPFLRAIVKKSKDPETLLVMADAANMQRTSSHRFSSRALFVLACFVAMNVAFIVVHADSTFIALASAAVLLIGLRAEDVVLKAIDVDVLAIFVSLFVMSGAVGTTDVLRQFGAYLMSLRLSPFFLSMALMIAGAFVTSLLSAGPTTVLLVSLAATLSAAIPGNLSWWALSLGVLAGSSATPWGATAGPVTMGFFEHKTGQVFSYWSFLRIGLPSAALFLLLASVYMALRTLVFHI